MPETSTTFSSAPSAPSSSSERERILAEIERALPGLFAARLGQKKVKAVGWFVSQFWDDEADDAVHGELRASFVDDEPPERFHRPYEDEDDADDDTSAFDALFTSEAPDFDSNGEMINAFASFACESNQDDREFVAYCVWRRGADGGFERTVVGEMLRPEWEDSFAKAKRPSSSSSSASSSASSSSSKKKWPKWLGLVVPLLVYAVLKLLTEK